MTIEEAMEELKTPQYIGEEGDMVVNCKTKEGAFRKFRKQIIEDCGEDHDLLNFSLDDISVGFVFVPTEEEKKNFEEDTEYYVSYTKQSPYEVWVLTY